MFLLTVPPTPRANRTHSQSLTLASLKITKAFKKRQGLERRKRREDLFWTRTGWGPVSCQRLWDTVLGILSQFEATFWLGKRVSLFLNSTTEAK